MEKNHKKWKKKRTAMTGTYFGSFQKHKYAISWEEHWTLNKISTELQVLTNSIISNHFWDVKIGISEHFFFSTLTAVLLLCISYFHDSCQYEYKIQRTPGPGFCIFFVLSLSISGSKLLSITDNFSLSNLWFDSLITWLIFPTLYLLSSSNSESILIPLLT